MTMIGDGRGVNPYQNFSRDEFNIVIHQAPNDKTVFFRGDYHSSWIFSKLRRKYVEDRFNGIPVNNAVYGYLRYIRENPPKNHEINLKRDFPYDLGLVLQDFELPEDFFRRLTQNQSSGLIFFQGNKNEVVPIFHLPLTKINAKGDLVTRIIKHREDDIIGVKKVERKLALLIKE